MKKTGIIVLSIMIALVISCGGGNDNEKAEKALKYAQKNGAEETEIIVSKTDILTVNIENGETSFGGKDYHQGIGIELLKIIH